MIYEHKPGTGGIFKNSYKQKENHPDYRGEIKTPSGELLEVALWIKEGKNGKFFSASVQVPRERNQEKPEPAKESQDFDDDIPF